MCTLPSWEELVMYWNKRVIPDLIFTMDDTGVKIKYTGMQIDNLSRL